MAVQFKTFAMKFYCDVGFIILRDKEMKNEFFC